MRLRDILKHYTSVKCEVCNSSTLYKNHYVISGKVFCYKCYTARMITLENVNESIQNKSCIEMIIDGVSTDENGYVVITGRRIYGACLCGDTLEYHGAEYTVLRRDVKLPLHTGPYPICVLTLESKEAYVFRTGETIRTCRTPKKINPTLICRECKGHVLPRYMNEDEICDKCDKKRRRAAERNGETLKKAAPVINDSPIRTAEPPTTEVKIKKPERTAEEISLPETITENEHPEKRGSDFTRLPPEDYTLPHYTPDQGLDNITSAPPRETKDSLTDTSDTVTQPIAKEHDEIRARASRYAPYMPNTVRAQIDMLKNLSPIIDISCVTSSDKISWDFTGRNVTNVLRNQFDNDLDTLILLIEESLSSMSDADLADLSAKISTASEEELLKASVSLEFYLSAVDHAPHVQDLLKCVYSELSSR